VLRANLGWLRVSPEAGDVADALGIVRASLLAAIDRRPVRIHAGPCSAPVEVMAVGERDGMITVGVRTETCGAPLYAQSGRAVLVCERCGATHSPTDRKAFQLAALRDEVLPLDEALIQIERLTGLALDRALIRKWRQRRRLIACVNAAGVQSYRVGDLLELAEGTDLRPGPRRAAIATG
jgi:hypothetical protein